MAIYVIIMLGIIDFAQALYIKYTFRTIEKLTLINQNYCNKILIYEEKKSIDENKLDELADKLNPNNPHGDNYEVGQYFGFQDGFKAGYRKAMEE